MAKDEKKLPHIRIQRPSDSIGFTTTQSGDRGNACPERNRKPHGEYIKKKLEEAWKESENKLAVAHSGRKGINLEFKTSSDIDIEKLESLPQGIRLCNVRNEEDSDTKYVTVYIPNDKKKLKIGKSGVEEEVITKFDELLQSQNIESKKGYIKFTERFVKLVYASEEQLRDIIRNSDDIAEYRRAKTTAEFLLSQKPVEQGE